MLTDISAKIYYIPAGIPINNYPYINSSKFSANWRATATYEGMVVE